MHGEMESEGITAKDLSRTERKRPASPLESDRRDAPGAGAKQAVQTASNAEILKKRKQLASIETRIASVESEIEETKAKIKEMKAKLKDPDNAEATVKRHIRLLHEYNEIRDVGSGLFGIIADQRSVTIGEVYEEFGVKQGD